MEHGIPRIPETGTEYANELSLSFLLNQLPSLFGRYDRRRHAQLRFAIDRRERHLLDRGSRAELRSHASEVQALLSDLDDVIRAPLQGEPSIGMERDAIAGREALLARVYTHKGGTNPQQVVVAIACNAHVGEGCPTALLHPGLLGAPRDAARFRGPEHLDRGRTQCTRNVVCDVRRERSARREDHTAHSPKCWRVSMPYESLQMGRNTGEHAVAGVSHARNQLAGMEVVVSLKRVPRVERPQDAEEKSVHVLVRSRGKEGRLTDQRVPGGVQLTDLVFQMANALGHRLLAIRRSGCEELHGECIGTERCQTAGVSGFDALDRMENRTLRKPVTPVRENTRRAGVEGAQRVRLSIRRRDRTASGMPERKESNRKRIGILSEEHPRAVRLRRDPILQASHVSPECVPTDHLVRPGDVIPMPGDFGGRIAILLEEMTERAHLTRLSATKAVRLRTDSKIRWFDSGSSSRVTP